MARPINKLLFIMFLAIVLTSHVNSQPVPAPPICPPGVPPVAQPPFLFPPCVPGPEPPESPNSPDSTIQIAGKTIGWVVLAVVLFVLGLFLWACQRQLYIGLDFLANYFSRRGHRRGQNTQLAPPPPSTESPSSNELVEVRTSVVEVEGEAGELRVPPEAHH